MSADSNNVASALESHGFHFVVEVPEFLGFQLGGSPGGVISIPEEDIETAHGQEARVGVLADEGHVSNIVIHFKLGHTPGLVGGHLHQVLEESLVVLQAVPRDDTDIATKAPNFYHRIFPGLM